MRTHPDDAAADLTRTEARHEAAQQRHDAARHEIADDGELAMLRRSLTTDALSTEGRQNTEGRIAWLMRGCVPARLAAE